MQTICIKTKVKAGYIEEVRRWFKELRNRQDEVLETMRNEGVVVESAFIDKRDEDFYIIYYMKANNVEKAYEVFSKSTSPIDIYFKESWRTYFEGRIVLEEVLDLELISFHPF